MSARSASRILLLVLSLTPILGSCLPSVLPHVIKIGLAAPFEGEYRDVGYDAVYAARLAIREINAAGGIDGWMLELVAYDDRADVDLAGRVARNIAIDPDVVVVLGHFRPETSTAVAPIYREAGVPFLVLGAGGGEEDGVWHLSPASGPWAQALLEAGSASGTGPRAVVGSGSLVDALLREATGRPAVQLSPEAAPGGTGEVYLALAPAEAGETALRWRRAGWQGQLLGGTDLSASAFATVAGDAAVGAQFVTPYPFPRDVPETDTWIADYRAIGPHVPDPGPYALPTYEGIRLVAATIHRIIASGSPPDRQTLGAALSSVVYTGWLGSMTWDARHYWVDAPLYLYRWTEEGPHLIRKLP